MGLVNEASQKQLVQLCVIEHVRRHFHLSGLTNEGASARGRGYASAKPKCANVGNGGRNTSRKHNENDAPLNCDDHCTMVVATEGASNARFSWPGFGTNIQKHASVSLDISKFGWSHVWWWWWWWWYGEGCRGVEGNAIQTVVVPRKTKPSKS